MYGFNNQTLYNYINGDFSREKIKEHEIATCFECKENSNIFKVKEMYRNKFKELIVSKLGRESTIKPIDKVFYNKDRNYWIDFSIKKSYLNNTKNQLLTLIYNYDFNE